MNEKYFLLLQPYNFDDDYDLKTILLIDMRGNTLINCSSNDRDFKNCKAKIQELIKENALFITYNGYLLKGMLTDHFGVPYKRIISLMDKFAFINGEMKGWLSEGNRYIWKKLDYAINYYVERGYIKRPDKPIDIYNADEVLHYTYLLYKAIQQDEFKKELEEFS